MQIRAPDAADLPGLTTLLCGAEEAGLPGRLDAVSRFPGITLIAQEWGPPSGLVALHWYPTLMADYLTARMVILLVAPDARRRGLGRLLLKSASQAARIAGCDLLECFAGDDQPALPAFLLATGFTQSHMRFVRPLRKRAATPS